MILHLGRFNGQHAIDHLACLLIKPQCCRWDVFYQLVTPACTTFDIDPLKFRVF